MTNQTPLPGELWTVPGAGPSALVLVLSDAGVASNGAPDFQGIGIHRVRPDGSDAFVDEMRLDEAEVDAVGPYAVELWNLRPLLVSQLGNRVGRMVSAEAFDLVWDAVLRNADRDVPVPADRLGRRVPGPALINARHAILEAWHSLSMVGCHQTARVRYQTASAGTFSVEDQAVLSGCLVLDAGLTWQVLHGHALVPAAMPPVGPRLIGALLPPASQPHAPVIRFYERVPLQLRTQTLNVERARASVALSDLTGGRAEPLFTHTFQHCR